MPVRSIVKVTFFFIFYFLDKVQHPMGKQQAAKEYNNGGKGLKNGNPPDASFRPVTADGGRLSDFGV